MPPARKVLILFAHPAFEKSRVQRELAGAVHDLPGVTFHDLYQEYPELDIEVSFEQARLLAHDVIVMQHPLYWYSTPSMLKEWQDLVLEHGWAYGQDGTALRGKVMMSAISAGGRRAAYAPDGRNRRTIREFLAPIEATARLCGMTYLPPFVVHGTHSLDDARLAQHARDYRRFMQALVDGAIDLSGVSRDACVNDRLHELLPVPTDGAGS